MQFASRLNDGVTVTFGQVCLMVDKWLNYSSDVLQRPALCVQQQTQRGAARPAALHPHPSPQTARPGPPHRTPVRPLISPSIGDE